MTQAAIRELQERANQLQKRKDELQTELMYGPPASGAPEDEAVKLANKVEELEYAVAIQEERLGLSYSGLKLREVLSPEDKAERDASFEKARRKQEEENKKYLEWLAKQQADTDPFTKLTDVTWDERSRSAINELWAGWSFERKGNAIGYLMALSKEVRQRKISTLPDVIVALKIAAEGLGPHLNRDYLMKLPVEWPDVEDAGSVIGKLVSGNPDSRSLARRLSNALDEGIEQLQKVEAEAWNEKRGKSEWVDGKHIHYLPPVDGQGEGFEVEFDPTVPELATGGEDALRHNTFNALYDAQKHIIPTGDPPKVAGPDTSPGKTPEEEPKS